jgi:hypothetical protein
MYCDHDATVVTWSSFDPTYRALVHQKHPWMLDPEERTVVEESIIDCPCGGRFFFSALPRCPSV